MEEAEIEKIRKIVAKWYNNSKLSVEENSLEVSVEDFRSMPEYFFDNLVEDLSRIGYTAFTSGSQRSSIFIVPAGESYRRKGNLSPIFLVLTVASLVFVGFLYTENFFSQGSAVLTLIYSVIFFVLPMLFFMFFREFGRLIASKRNSIKYTMPIFIPNPVSLGFIGSVNVNRKPYSNSKSMVEIGGIPILFGYVASFFLIALGSLPMMQNIIYSGSSSPVYSTVGQPLLFLPVLRLVSPPSGIMSPVEFAGWVGTIVNSLNALPLGSLDGGLLWKGVLGNRISSVQLPVIAVLVIVGLFFPFLIILPIFLIFLGYHSPEPLNAISRPGALGRSIFVAVIVLMVFGLVPVQTHAYMNSMEVTPITHSAIDLLGTGTIAVYELGVINTGNNPYTPSFSVSPSFPFYVSGDTGAIAAGQESYFNITVVPQGINQTGLYNITITAYSGLVKVSVGVELAAVGLSRTLSVDHSVNPITYPVVTGQTYHISLYNSGDAGTSVTMYIFSQATLNFTLTLSNVTYIQGDKTVSGLLSPYTFYISAGETLNMGIMFNSITSGVTLAFVGQDMNAAVIDFYSS